MSWCIELSTLQLTVLDERGEKKETLGGEQLEHEVSSITTVLATVPLDSLVSLRMDSRKDTVLAMIALFRRGTPFIVVGNTSPTVTKWSLEKGRELVENEGKDIDRLEPGIAYSICTSGTTGARKRVDVPSECIRLNVEDFKRRFSFTPSSPPHSILQCASFHFDVSMIDVLLWATTPGTHLFLPEREATRAPAALPNAITKQGVTFVQMCPSLLYRCSLPSLQQLLRPQSQLRVMLVGGEPFPHHLINIVRHPNCSTRIYDVYGVTEVSCWATVAEVPHGATTVILGEPIDGTEINIDDEQRLLIGGARRRCIVGGVRDGEWTDSGDRVEAVDGGWKILGRAGDEVKLHGVRVNLVQAARQLGQIRPNAALFAKFVVHRTNFLVLFVQGDVSREEVDSVLPPGVSVQHIEPIHEVPLNSSGKVDTQALRTLLDEPAAADENTLSEELERLGISPSVNEDSTLTELGLDSAAMLRLAFALKSEVCTKLILAGDVSMRQLREVMSGGGAGARSSSGIIWPKRTTAQLEKDGDQRSIAKDQRSNMKERWSHPMEKCVDAAPLIIQRPDCCLVVIGSYSGLVVCLEEKRGATTLKWASRMPHRVETAAVEAGEGRIAVCGYDGVVICFDLETGEEWWRYDCEANVRGGLVADREFIYIGDYDGRLHKIDVAKRHRLWYTQVGKAMRSLPTINGRWAATVTFQGDTTVVDTESGAIVWRDEGKGRPIFASGLFLRAGSRTDNLVTVDVDGHIIMRNGETGEEITSISIHARVFSTPLQVDSAIVFVTASDAGNPSSLLLLAENLTPLKRIDFASSTTVSIYHTPVIKNQAIVMMASSGVLITVPMGVLGDDNIEGKAISSKRLLPSGGAPIFSPPRFVMDDAIVLGTRDDVVVSLKL